MSEDSAVASEDFNLHRHIKEIILKSIRTPLLYLLAGLVLMGLSTLNRIIHITKWDNLLYITDKLGQMLVSLAALTLVYNLVVYICDYYERKYLARQQVTALIFSTLLTGARIIYVLAVINLVITLLGLSSFYLEFANNIINVIMICAVAWVAIQVLYTFESALYQYMMQLSTTEHVRIKALYTKMHIIRNITTVVIVVLTIAAILMSFNSVRNIGISLLASAGFLTAIIGLSAQKALYSLFSGLQVALSQAVKIGDVVVIEGNSGIIEEITFTYVTLKLGDRKRLMVPINYLIEKPFENWSHRDDSLRSSFIMHVDYNTPIEPLRKELDKILKESSFWDQKAGMMQISDVTANSVEIRVQISAANADNLSDLRAEVKERLLLYIQTHYPEHFPKKR